MEETNTQLWSREFVGLQLQVSLRMLISDIIGVDFVSCPGTEVQPKDGWPAILKR